MFEVWSKYEKRFIDLEILRENMNSQNNSLFYDLEDELVAYIKGDDNDLQLIMKTLSALKTRYAKMKEEGK